MKRIAMSCFAAAVLFTQPAAAYVVHFDSPGNAIAVTGLLVDHALYDVTFEYGTFNEVFADELPAFWGRLPWLAGEALALALTSPVLALSAGPQPAPSDSVWGDIGVISIPFNFIGGPTDFVAEIIAPPSFAVCSGPVPDHWNCFGLYGWGVDHPSPVLFAVFTYIPEPATLALLGLALAGLGLARRRKLH